MAGHLGEIDEEKSSYFQDVTGVRDGLLSQQMLEAYGWDLDAAVNAMIDKASQEIPEYEAGLKLDAEAAANGRQWEVSGDERGCALEQEAGLASASPSYFEERSARRGVSDRRYYRDGCRERNRRFGRAEGYVDACGNNSVVDSDAPGRSVVGRIVTLPFSIVVESYNLVCGAVSFGMRMAGAVLNYSLGAFGWSGAGRREESHAVLPVSEAATFLRRFEKEYGEHHPAFQLISFREALRRAYQQSKFLFVYLHSSEHANTPSFCERILCAESVVQFVDENFVAWGGDVRASEGFELSNNFRASTFPFCAVVTESSNHRILVLQQVEGPRSAAELTHILQTVVKEQGAALVATNVEEEEHKLNHHLHDEQDVADQLALQMEKRGQRELEQQEEEAREVAELELGRSVTEARAARAAERGLTLEHRRDKAMALVAEPEEGQEVTRVMVRLPTGERKEHRFESRAKVQAIYDFVDSLGDFHTAKYSLVSHFPLVVYGPDKLNLTLKSAGLHPQASLYVQEEDSYEGTT